MHFGTFDAPALGSRPFEELSAKEATVIAEVAAGSIPAALARVVSDIGQPDPSDPATSLRAVWTWFLGRLPLPQQPARSAWWRRRNAPEPVVAVMSWDDVDPSTLPYWCWFRDGSGIFLPLGPRICLDVDAVNAYVVTLLAAIHPGSEIVRCTGTRMDVDFRQPALRLPDGREYVLPHRHVIDASRALDPEHRYHASSCNPDRQVDLLRVWVRPLDPVHVAPASVFEVVSIVQPNEFGFIVTVDEEVAHEHSDRLDRVVAAVACEVGVSRVHREDREVLLLAAPTLSAGQIEGLLNRVWQSLNP